jgi:hypothetical protein
MEALRTLVAATGGRPPLVPRRSARWRIVEGDAAIEHPPLKNWESTNEKQANLKAHLVQRHETKGEPLVVFAPGRPPACGTRGSNAAGRSSTVWAGRIG